MPKKLPLNVFLEPSRHGTARLYYRVGKGPRTRMPDDPNSAEFKARYKALHSSTQPVPEPARQAKSLRWLIERYKESAAWRQLSDATRYQRDKIFIKAIEASKNVDFREIDRHTIERNMGKKANTPAQANSFLKAMRGLFEWALKNDHVEINPCIGVDRLKDQTDGFPAWTTDDVIAFRAKHDIGTKPRLAMEFMLLTGLRRGDMATVGRQHIRDGVLTLKTRKTGAVVTIGLPQYLIDMIEATPIKGMHLISQDSGSPYTVESFGNYFREWCDEADVDKSAHGLRKLSATLAADGGAAAHELMAQYGWAKISQAEIYTKGADRARLGKKNSAIVAGQIGNIESPHPNPARPAPKRKAL
jgi:integrase